MHVLPIGLTGTCRYCTRDIELRGMSGGGLGLSWDDDWRARPDPADKTADTRLCQARIELAQARFARRPAIIISRAGPVSGCGQHPAIQHLTRKTSA